MPGTPSRLPEMCPEGDMPKLHCICNVLIIPGTEWPHCQNNHDQPQRLTVADNDSNRFECRWVYLRIDQESPCIFTRGMSTMYLPVAHGEGTVMAEPETLNNLNVVLRYADERGDVQAGYPCNPNDSVDNIAGICDDSGHVFALMPHPERFIHWTQHPRWTRETPRKHGDGFGIFLNAVEWVKSG